MKCLRCESKMVKDLNLTSSNGGYAIDIREKGLFKNGIEKVKCAVCPNCGHIELYIDNTEKIRQLADNL